MSKLIFVVEDDVSPSGLILVSCYQKRVTWFKPMQTVKKV